MYLQRCQKESQAVIATHYQRGRIASEAVPESSIVRGAHCTLLLTTSSEVLGPGCWGRYSTTISMLPRPGMTLVVSVRSVYGRLGGAKVT